MRCRVVALWSYQGWSSHTLRPRVLGCSAGGKELSDDSIISAPRATYIQKYTYLRCGYIWPLLRHPHAFWGLSDLLECRFPPLLEASGDAVRAYFS